MINSLFTCGYLCGYPPYGSESTLTLLPLIRLRKILSAYNDGRPFSLDLVGAVGLYDTKRFSRGTHDRAEQVLRQGAFTEKMHQLGWSQPGFFDSKEDEVALHHCVSRYHAYVQDWVRDGAILLTCGTRFLDLIASAPTSFFVPTLDIDIAWQ